ncbi:MAG: hypothetical protein KDA63_00405 [Planctomycetales bacterium]|nr:hypothetical protein [Planctomycetales bacterium]
MSKKRPAALTDAASSLVPTSVDRPPLWLAMPLAAMAGGMGWGIRGQYGHETGAMLAGVLVGLVLVLLFAGRLTRLSAARAAAMFVLGIGVGGSMTYGQTVGLTHDPSLVGNAAALRWGLLGLFIKGGIWISFGAALLGMGLSAVRYRPIDLAILLLVLICLYYAGVYAINEPYEPGKKELPAIYFSADWQWQPDATDLKPRLEKWGGLYTALAGLAVYTLLVKNDQLAFRLLIWGLVGGGLGFSLGQCAQASHAWHPEFYAEGWRGWLTFKFNWWNIMEISFGAIWAATLTLGVWLNRHLIGMKSEADEVEITPAVEWLLVVLYVAGVGMWNFGSFAALDTIADRALPVIVLPMIAVVTGRFWPYLVLLPLTAFPIAVHTLLGVLKVHENEPGVLRDVLIYLVLPLSVATAVAVYFARSARQQEPARGFARVALALATLIYYGLNMAVFGFPFYWADFPARETFPLWHENWSGRTSSEIIFAFCTICLLAAAAGYGRLRRGRAAAPRAKAQPEPA